MNATTSWIYEKIREVSPELLQWDETPLLENFAPFPWNSLADSLAKTFQLTSLKLEPFDLQQRLPQDLYTGLGEPLLLSLQISPLQGTLYWAMAERDARWLMALCCKQSKESIDQLDGDFVQGFYRFLAHETLFALSETEYGKALSIHLLSESSFPQETCLCLDARIILPEKTLFGRLFLSQEFRKEWNKRFSQKNVAPFALKEGIETDVCAQIGKTRLKLSEWKKIKPGDALLLDSCQLELEGEKGRALLTLQGVPLFQAKIQDGQLTILEHLPYNEEAEIAMSKKIPDEDDSFMEDSDFEDSVFDDLDLDETEEETEEDSPEELDLETEESSPFSEEDPTEETTIEEEDFSLPSEEDLKEETEIDLTEETDLSLPGEESEKEETLASPLPLTPPPSSSLKQGEKKEKRHSGKIEDISLPIAVEIGRLRMPLQKIMQLQPGNLLELPFHLEEGVDLSINGRRIAKGELIRLGEVLGVRILEID